MVCTAPLTAAGEYSFLNTVQLSRDSMTKRQAEKKYKNLEREVLKGPV